MLRHMTFAFLVCVYSIISTARAQCDSSFATPVNYPVGNAPRWVARADLNNDNHLDLVVANQGANSVSVMLGLGNGTFAAAVNYNTGSGPRAVAIADLNGDTIPDLVTANEFGANVSVLLGI